MAESNKGAVIPTAPNFLNLKLNTMKRVEKFYNEGSILPENKYIVGLYGDYVLKALDYMKSGTERKDVFTGRGDIQIPKKTYPDILAGWLERHTVGAESPGGEVDFGWTVNDVKIPTVKAETVSDLSIDTTKQISYPLVTSAQKTDTITLSIVEDRYMGMYQFLNSLNNQFFSTQLLKPKSSFQKLNMYIIVLNGHNIRAKGIGREVQFPDGTTEKLGKNIITDIPLQVFEFNSIVMKGMGTVNLKQSSNVGRVSYNVSFEAPNIFQGAFTNTTLAGLMDNTSDRNHYVPYNLNPATGGGTDKRGDYNNDLFEE